jgi:exodeoxyribonuclease-5
MDTVALSSSPQQRQALASVHDWLDSGTNRKPYFRLFGYAGTGKTTLARHLAATIDGHVAYAAYSGKAALMMRKSGCEGASTIHKLIYWVEQLPGGGSKFVLNPRGAASKASLVVIDECSMVDDAIARDLMSFGKPLLILGDPAQLPPVRGSGYFTSGEPDVLLTEIHRQARGSGIIEVSMAIRNGKLLPKTIFDDVTMIVSDDGFEKALLAADQVIAGKNQTVNDLNRGIRAMKGFSGPIPNVGEKLICCRNDAHYELLNGEQVVVVGVGETSDDPDTCWLTVRSLDVTDGREFDVEVLVSALEDGPSADELYWCCENSVVALRFGYAITAHKAQGSQWPHVLVFDESSTFRDSQSKWLYTAATRASEHLSIFSA